MGEMWPRCKTGALVISVLIVGGFVVSEILGNPSPALEGLTLMIVSVWFGRYTKARELSKSP